MELTKIIKYYKPLGNKQTINELGMYHSMTDDNEKTKIKNLVDKYSTNNDILKQLGVPKNQITHPNYKRKLWLVAYHMVDKK